MTWLWVAWLGLFVILEGYALWTDKRGDTLSETTWRWFRIHTPGWHIRRIILAGFLGWLLIHLTAGY